MVSGLGNAPELTAGKETSLEVKVHGKRKIESFKLIGLKL